MDTMPLIQIENLKKYYLVNNGIKDIFSKEKKYVKAIDDISLIIKKGEILGLAGESGSGKTTTGEILVRLQEPSDGNIIFDGHVFKANSKIEEKKFRKEVQMIFQDPYETLNPRFNIFDTIAEPLKIHGVKNRQDIYDRVIKALEIAELKPAEHYITRYPHELSGGQRQRVAIARGIVLEPKFLVADEPVSMLDVSIRADILNLLKNLRKKMGLTMLYVSHDLSTIKYLCDRIAIMYLGKIVEIGNVKDVIDNPQHPYTKVLLSSVPVADPDYKRQSIIIEDEVPDQIHLPEGCRFGPRCPYSTEDCKNFDHTLFERRTDQWSACIYNEEELRK
ncbi:ABC transporter ATP-binding protein [Alkaliphilus peptidifermentans]|uniref:Peptide/nickel transport system ATP-binding protein n=1 Tax=Alkaliphilus peptidifermentans DSM 18978 TaxID=1120976 RepID=A0A1G5KW82_9FIRM|nr:oligopeptide/dipeptide ABC transporter ATP-binding protein [Alkaliphilus peptidifermentans]SCZ04872.1 peptide/nickel transport system ATP-binding protein [Alkaliphilus peptidifermentans DSM 18978]